MPTDDLDPPLARRIDTRADGAPDPFTPVTDEARALSRFSARVLDRLDNLATRADIDGLRGEVSQLAKEVANLGGRVDGVTSGLTATAVRRIDHEATQETNRSEAAKIVAEAEGQAAKVRAEAERAASEARWRVAQTAVSSGVLQGAVATVILGAAAIAWYLVTGDTTPPIPGVAP
jgi:hypothetical protein